MDTNENNTTGRASYSEEERRELIEEYQSSGLTQAAFCREWNLNSKTLARWLRIERDEKEVSFCEVELGNPSSSENEIPFLLPLRLSVLNRAFSTILLRKIIYRYAFRRSYTRH